MVSKAPARLQLPVDSKLWNGDFLLGVATSAFQIEGNSEDRQRSIWDAFCERRGRIADDSNGLVACDHVARVEEDLDLLDHIDVDAYRFSISWGRLLNEDGSLNPSGLDFYQRLIDGLVRRGIRPWATLYHWDLPQYHEERGGWLNRDTAYRFAEYVDRATRALDNGVAAWMTLNEPECSAYLGYAIGVHAPGQKVLKNYAKAAHHLLLAHGLGMNVLAQNQPDVPRGIVLNLSCVQAATEDPKDQEAARQANLSFYRRFLDPILKGRYDDGLGTLPDEERPVIGTNDLRLISQPMDFLGINYYTRAIYRAGDDGRFEELPPEGTLTDMGWEVYPQGLTDVLVGLDEDYELPPVYITESGAAFPDRLRAGEVVDTDRFEYIQSQLLAIDAAVRQGVDVRGLFCWSFLDNFEWSEGFTKRFGIVHVDYPTQKRTLKMSGYAWRDLLQERRERMNGRISVGGN